MESSFRRIENKYLLTDEQKEIILKRLAEKMSLDAYCSANGRYVVHNIYFDDEGDDVILRSLSSPLYKDKLRLRSYGGASPVYFLEIKRKFQSDVYKRRVTLTAHECEDFLKQRRLPANSGEYCHDFILKEIAAFLREYPMISPKVVLQYERVAFINRPSEAYLRATVDSSITARRRDFDINKLGGEDILGPRVSLLEIKISQSIPKWLSDLLNEAGTHRVGFSKYGREFLLYRRRVLESEKSLCEAEK
jgi:SPX domain protein involved in polyphosphate accumulation